MNHRVSLSGNQGNIDNLIERSYNAGEVEAISYAAAQQAVMATLGMLGITDNQHKHLDNGTAQEEQPLLEGDASMASQHRETYTYFDENGKRQSIRLCGTDKRDTDAKFQRFLCQPQQRQTAPTVRAFVDSVYRPSFMQGLAETTKTNYELYLSLNILPFMGHMPMDTITVATIQSFYDWMATAGSRGRKNDLNQRTIERIGGFASRIFRVAYEMKLIEDTPFKPTLLRNNGTKAGHHKALPDEEVDRIKRAIPYLKDERQRLYMGLLVYTGMRREEVMGLRWEHIHLAEGYGEIYKVVVYPGNSTTVIKENPKTEKSERVFCIPLPLKNLLEPHQEKSGYVIHGRKLEEPASQSTMKRTYQKAFELLGIKGKFNNHDWRTTFGTQMKERGMTSAQVADLLGHADTRMVETVYARTRKQGILKHQEAIEKMNKAYACGS